MKRNSRWMILAIGLGLALFAFGVASAAISGGTFGINWWTVDGGGGMSSTGGGYSLSGTIGQPDAGQMSGGGYVLAGGFWSGAGGEPEYQHYLPLVVGE